jgi:VWFA-related protein
VATVRRLLVLAVFVASWSPASRTVLAQQPTFKSTVARVAVSAVVKTKHGKAVTNLKADDFQLFDSGEARPIAEFRTEPSPVSVGLLVDFSGSMDVASRRQAAHDNAFQVLSWLDPGVDQAGLYVFDKQLHELHPVAPAAPADILSELDSFARPFGATSLFDAIAETGRTLANEGGPRRAVVALTDGADNASHLTAEEVSGIASSIDVPVYIIIVISPYDRAGRTTVDDARLLDAAEQGPLGNLARWTGGDLFVGVGPSQSAQAAREIVTDLRQQYLIAFEPGTRPGWHPIDLRTRDKDLIVRARSGYLVSGSGSGD